MKKIGSVTIFFISVFFLTSCASSSSSSDQGFSRVNDEQLNKINSMYYSFSSRGFTSAVLRCKSLFFGEMVSRIKDPILKGQLQNTVFTVEWVKPSKFSGRVDNVPELPKKTDNDVLVKAIVHAKDRMRGAIQMDAFFFDGIFAGKNVFVGQESVKLDGLNIFAVKNSQHQTILKLYFDGKFLLNKIELIDGTQVKTEIKYQFDELSGGKYLLKSANAVYPGSAITSSIDVLYDKKDGLIVPQQIKIKSTIGNEEVDDTIDIVSCTSRSV